MMKPNWDDAPVEATHWCESKLEWRDETEDTISDCCIRIPDCEPSAPDDGELCVVWDDECNQGTFFLCEYQEDGPRFQLHPKGGCFAPDEVSGYTRTGIMVRTQEQRERDELQEIISDAYESGVGVIAAEIIAAGWTREKQDD